MTYSKLINHGGKTVSYAGARLLATMDMVFTFLISSQYSCSYCYLQGLVQRGT